MVNISKLVTNYERLQKEVGKPPVCYAKVINLYLGDRFPFEAEVTVNGNLIASQCFKYHAQARAFCDNVVYNLIKQQTYGTGPYVSERGGRCLTLK